MRIAVLTNDFPPHLKGGAGHIASLQVEWLKAHGYDVRVWHPVIHPKKPFNFAQSLGRVVFHVRDLATNQTVAREIVAWKPDVLISHNLTGCGWGTAREVRWQIPCRWIHLLHDVQLFEPSGQICAGESFSLLRWVWRNGWAFLRKSFFGIPDAVISPSQWLLDQHRRFGFFKQTPTHVIPNPIEKGNHSLRSLGKREKEKEKNLLKDTLPPAFSGASPHSSLPARNAFASSSCMAGGFPLPFITYIGRLSHDKGVGVLLDAWKQLKDDTRLLVLIGDGPLRKDCEAMADQNVVTLGALPHAEVLEHLKQASLLVLPSLVMENQPTVLLEAIASGVPMVATDVGGVRELLDGYGTVIPSGDSNTLSRALSHPPIADVELGKRILFRHGIDTVMKKWTELF